MTQPTLYLFIGAPGAGKTTVARIIAENTGARHLWADAERHKLYGKPSHSTDESRHLYDNLNQQTAQLLSQGNSVVFDTNFNFYRDRQKLRDIAQENRAKTVLIWITTPQELAKKRALDPSGLRNGYGSIMTAQQFEAMVNKFETPTKDERFIKIDGSQLDHTKVKQLLKL